MKTAKKIIDGQVYEFEVVDLWSRPGIWSRQRAYLFLAINMIVYAALNLFIYWIHQAKWVDFSWKSYTITYHKTLIDFLFFPINIHEAPVLIPIFGMLMASLIAVPILISQLYGFRYSVPYSLCVLILAHLPVLCLFLLVSSFIAGVSKQRYPFKFAVTLLSLLSLAPYFYVATRGAAMLQFKPVDPILLYAPWVLAFLAAAVLSAIVLAFARLVNYRPGGILIAMIPFFMIPGLLFHRFIGADQLEFRLLAHRFGPASATFTPIDISSRVFQETLKNWRRYKVRDLQSIVDEARFEFPYLAQQINQDDRNKILTVCNKFLKTYPHSRFVPNALYIEGLALDMRFDYQALFKKWTVEYTTDQVNPQSRPIWLRLINQYPDSVYAQPAMFRLAVIALREGNPATAAKLLDNLLASSRKFTTVTATTHPSDLPTSIKELFMEPRLADVPAVDLNHLDEQARELAELIRNNADDPRYGIKPLQEFMLLDPNHPQYRANILELAGKYPSAKLYDNLLVQYALTDPDPQHRRETLEQYAERFLNHDAGAKALYEIASLLQAWGLANMDHKAHLQARYYYALLIRHYPNSTFAPRAHANLTQLTTMEGQLYSENSRQK